VRWPCRWNRSANHWVSCRGPAQIAACPRGPRAAGWSPAVRMGSPRGGCPGVRGCWCDGFGRAEPRGPYRCTTPRDATQPAAEPLAPQSPHTTGTAREPRFRRRDYCQASAPPPRHSIRGVVPASSCPRTMPTRRTTARTSATLRATPTTSPLTDTWRPPPPKCWCTTTGAARPRSPPGGRGQSQGPSPGRPAVLVRHAMDAFAICRCSPHALAQPEYTTDKFCTMQMSWGVRASPTAGDGKRPHGIPETGGIHRSLRMRSRP
jgi:hypothetical protein